MYLLFRFLTFANDGETESDHGYRGTAFWKVMAARLAFVIIFEVSHTFTCILTFLYSRNFFLFS